jgi:hypothetical protein
MSKRINRGDTVSFWITGKRYEGQVVDSDGHWVTVKVGDRHYDKPIGMVVKVK